MRRFLLPLLAAALAAAPGLAGAGPVADVVGNPWLDRGPVNFAHAGGLHEGPDNTLFAIKNTTLDGPADGFELDLHRTADGHVVALHDPTVDRSTDGSGPVQEKTLEEVKALDAAYWWVPGEGPVHDASKEEYVYRGMATGDNETPEGYNASDFRIPTLREVLENVTASSGDGPQPYMILEIKATSQHWRPLFRDVVALLEEFDRTEGAIVGSFNDASTTGAKALAPNVSTSPGLGQAAAWWAASGDEAPGAPFPHHDALQLPPTYSPPGGGPSFETLDQDRIQDAHGWDLAVHAWTINDEASMTKWLDAGVDGILTDEPSTLDAVLDARSST